MISRRSFIAALSALPFVSRLAGGKPAKTKSLRTAAFVFETEKFPFKMITESLGTVNAKKRLDKPPGKWRLLHCNWERVLGSKQPGKNFYIQKMIYRVQLLFVENNAPGCYNEVDFNTCNFGRCTEVTFHKVFCKGDQE